MSTFALKINPTLSKVLLIILSLLIIITLWLGLRFAFPGQITLFNGPRPTNLGIESGKLAPCPSSPNCVNSQSQNPIHQIAPLPIINNSTQTLADLKKIIQSWENTKIITEDENYLYVEFTSKIMGFVDDVEFFVDENAHLIQVRSASRLGESDLGVNRQRIENIRTKLLALSKS